MNATLRAVLVAAATYRITRLIQEDEITRPLREKIADAALEDPSPAKNALAYLIDCPYCVSVYAGFAAASLSRMGKPGFVATEALAASALTSLYYELRNKTENGDFD